VIQKQKPQRDAEADCLEDNCEHYTTTNRVTSTNHSTVAEDRRRVTDNIVAMSIAITDYQYELALKHAVEIVNAVSRIQQKRDDI
jgi:hypothetical protein